VDAGVVRAGGDAARGQHGDREPLPPPSARADVGDGIAAYPLADLLAEQGNVEDAIAVLRARADAGDPSTAYRLADLLTAQGRG
jgi:hypothetical protein